LSAIYFDHAATTPPHEDVLAAMIPLLRENFGNPSSIHALGQAARAAVDSAREKVAALIGASPSEIAFTSGGTEANNIAIFGAAVPASRETGRNHIVTSAIEHHSVFDACHVLEGRGFDVTYLPVDRLARVDPNRFARQSRTGPAWSR
jgi:cysteine desulfurase